MSFHKRHISNEQVVSLYLSGGSSNVIDWYTKGVDAVMAEVGLASSISDIINDPEWKYLTDMGLHEAVSRRINQHLGIDEISK